MGDVPEACCEAGFVFALETEAQHFVSIVRDRRSLRTAPAANPAALSAPITITNVTAERRNMADPLYGRIRPRAKGGPSGSACVRSRSG